jgi:biotin carboxyl carrier protein
MRYYVTVGDRTLEVEVEHRADGSYRVRGKDGPELEVTARANTPGVLDLLIDGESIRALPGDGLVQFRNEHYAVRSENSLERAAGGSARSNGSHSRRVLAAMPGRIIQISCRLGQAVTVGTPLVVMEAMKMQNELSAKTEGIVRAIPIVVGQNVERNQLLIELE